MIVIQELFTFKPFRQHYLWPFFLKHFLLVLALTYLTATFLQQLLGKYGGLQYEGGEMYWNAAVLTLITALVYIFFWEPTLKQKEQIRAEAYSFIQEKSVKADKEADDLLKRAIKLGTAGSIFSMGLEQILRRLTKATRPALRWTAAGVKPAPRKPFTKLQQLARWFFVAIMGYCLYWVVADVLELVPPWEIVGSARPHVMPRSISAAVYLGMGMIAYVLHDLSDFLRDIGRVPKDS